MNYTLTKIDDIKIIGPEVRTNNNKGVQEIPQLWQQFQQDNVFASIPNKTSNTGVYGIYTNYDSNEHGDYSFIIGCDVEKQDDVPKKMAAINIPSGTYAVFTATNRDQVFETWQTIWNTKLARKYTADFEIYDYTKPEVKVYIAVDEQSS